MVDIPQERKSPAAAGIPKRWNKKSSQRDTRKWVFCNTWKQATQRARLQATIPAKQAASKKHKKKPCTKQALKYS